MREALPFVSGFGGIHLSWENIKSTHRSNDGLRLLVAMVTEHTQNVRPVAHVDICKYAKTRKVKPRKDRRKTFPVSALLGWRTHWNEDEVIEQSFLQMRASVQDSWKIRSQKKVSQRKIRSEEWRKRRFAYQQRDIRSRFSGVKTHWQQRQYNLVKTYRT